MAIDEYLSVVVYAEMYCHLGFYFRIEPFLQVYMLPLFAVGFTFLIWCVTRKHDVTYLTLNT